MVREKDGSHNLFYLNDFLTKEVRICQHLRALEANEALEENVKMQLQRVIHRARDNLRHVKFLAKEDSKCLFLSTDYLF